MTRQPDHSSRRTTADAAKENLKGRFERDVDDVFGAFFRNSPDGILLLHPASGDIALANRAACELTGCDMAAIREMNIGSFFSADVTQLILGILHKQSEVPLQRRDNLVVYVDIQPVQVTFQSTDHLMLSLRDVSERRRLQAEMAQADRVAAMGMLAAGIAHEINNPLACVLSNLENLSDDTAAFLSTFSRFVTQMHEQFGEEDAARMMADFGNRPVAGMLKNMLEGFEDALSSTYRIREVTRALGIFSRVDTTSVGPVNVTHVLESAIAISSNEIRYRATLERDFGSLPTVVANDGLLAQLFLNLILTAVRSLNESTVAENTVVVRTRFERGLVFVIVDINGNAAVGEPGAVSSAASPVGQPLRFHSLHWLPVARKTLQDMGGDVEVTQEDGQIRKMVMSIPARAEQRTSTIVPVLAEVTPRSRRGRLLVVDDESGIRGIIRRMLQSEYDIVEADSGEAAMEVLARDADVDFILCDVMMPGMSGTEFHRRLSAMMPGLARRFAFITGGAFTELTRQYLAEVDVPCVDKPFQSAMLKKMVKTLMAERSGGEH